MNEATAKQLLRNPPQKPDETVLKSILDEDTFGVLEQMIDILSAANMSFGWRNYIDRKTWLGKAAFMKKTIVWISVWEGLIKESYYFTKKTRTY